MSLSAGCEKKTDYDFAGRNFLRLLEMDKNRKQTENKQTNKQAENKQTNSRICIASHASFSNFRSIIFRLSSLQVRWRKPAKGFQKL